MGKAVNAAMMGTIALTLGGDQLFDALGMPPPQSEYYNIMQQNKLYTCAGAYFLGNTVVENMLSTGAFEIYYDGKLVSSKIKTGSMPQMQMIVDAMDTAFRESPQAGIEGVGMQQQAYLPPKISSH